MRQQLDIIIQDSQAAITTLTKEAAETRIALAELDLTITERRLPIRPVGDDMKNLLPGEREKIMQSYARHSEDQARQSGMRNRLAFIEREIVNWQERIDIAAKQQK